MKLFWQVYAVIYKQGSNICSSTVEDVLKLTANEDLIEDFDNVTGVTYKDEDQWKYHLEYIIEQYRKTVLLELSNDIRHEIGKKSSKELAEHVNLQIREINSSDVKVTSFKEAYKKTISNIRDINEGRTRSGLLTGHNNFDLKVSISENKMILIAAQKKIGKSRFIVDLIDRLCNRNENIAIQWYTFEMRSEELIRCFISRKVRLTEHQLLGKNYKLSTDEVSKVEAAANFFDKYPIEFIDETMNIFGITSKFESFKHKNPNKHCICVVDNLGLIKPHIPDQLAFEDDVARMFKSLRDSTNSTIIAVHHLTKESESKWNKEGGYEPKINHIRGSSRIADFANQVILLHRPDNYDDLMQEAKAHGKEKQIKGLFIVDVAANRDGDAGKVIMRHELQYCMFHE
jgi:replicative DNA helicase